MDLSQAAEFAGRWAENQRGMVAVADALKGLGSMEQATKERKAALDAATKAHEAKLVEVKAAEKRVAELTAQHEAAETAHTDKVAHAASEAEALAARIVANARDAASKMAAASQEQERQAQEAHSKAMASMKTELDARKQELAEVRRTIAATQADHSNLSAQIEAMRTTARGVLG